MSRKKIVAATMTAAALGLAFAGYTATRANGTDEVPVPLRAMPLKAEHVEGIVRIAAMGLPPK